MGCCRENKDLIWRLFGRYPSGRWRGWDLFTRVFWRYRSYMFHDTVGKRWHRLWTCWSGCGKVQSINGPGEPWTLHCFKCERSVVETYRRTEADPIARGEGEG